MKILVEVLGTVFMTEGASRKRKCCLIECPSCGIQRIVTTANYKTYDTTMCNTCKAITHGEVDTKLYAVWTAMKQRCLNIKCAAYVHYGGRGITIHQPWVDSFVEFKEWSIRSGYIDTLSIDRTDNDDGYYPDNCRWATRSEQAQNKRTKEQVAGDKAAYHDMLITQETQKV